MSWVNRPSTIFRRYPSTIQIWQDVCPIKELKKNRIMIHTCWFIISEAMTVLLHQYGYIEALTFNQSIDLYKIIHSTESQNHQAIALFNLFGKDKKISFVETLSHVLISGELKNIIEAISKLHFILFLEHYNSARKVSGC